MKSRSALKAACTVLFVVLAFAIRVFADDVPKFRDPDANEHVKKWGPFIADYVASYEAMEAELKKRKYAAMDMGLFSRLKELQGEAVKVIGKLEPDEKKKFQDFFIECMNKITEVNEQIVKAKRDSPQRAGAGAASTPNTDDVPKFRDPDVNEYVEKLGQFIADYIASCEAMKAELKKGKYAAMDMGLISRLKELNGEAVKVVGKLEPDEKKKFQDFNIECMNKIREVTEQTVNTTRDSPQR